MFNRSRKVACSHCHGDNFWKGDPAPTDTLACRFCDSFIISYEEYIYNIIRKEAERMLAHFTDAESERDLAMLKSILSQQQVTQHQNIELL